MVDCGSLFPLAPTERDVFGIRELAAEFGITPRTLRFYEEERLLAPVREGTARRYSRRDRARLAWILRGKSAGFSLDELREWLDLYDRDDGRAAQWRAAAEQCRARSVQFRTKVAELEAVIFQLNHFADTIDCIVPDNSSCAVRSLEE